MKNKFRFFDQTQITTTIHKDLGIASTNRLIDRFWKVRSPNSSIITSNNQKYWYWIDDSVYFIKYLEQIKSNRIHWSLIILCDLVHELTI